MLEGFDPLQLPTPRLLPEQALWSVGWGMEGGSKAKLGEWLCELSAGGVARAGFAAPSFHRRKREGLRRSGG